MATILVRNGGFGELWRRHVLRRRRLDVREAGCQVSRACLAGIACQETEITRHQKALHVAFNILQPQQWLRLYSQRVNRMEPNPTRSLVLKTVYVAVSGPEEALNVTTLHHAADEKTYTLLLSYVQWGRERSGVGARCVLWCRRSRNGTRLGGVAMLKVQTDNGSVSSSAEVHVKRA